MDQYSNDGIYILFTESHEIFPNSLYGMYEIRMNGGIKIIFYSNWNLQQIQMKWKGVDKICLETEFCHLDLLSYGILYRISKQK